MAASNTRLNQTSQMHAKHKERAQQMKRKRAREMEKVLCRIQKPTHEDRYSLEEDMKAAECDGYSQAPMYYHSNDAMIRTLPSAMHYPVFLPPPPMQFAQPGQGLQVIIDEP